MSFEGFKGSIEVSSGLVGPNGRDIPLMHSGSVQVGSDPKNRLSAVLDGMQERIDESLTKDGGIVEGTLTLIQVPTEEEDAVNKKYVDKTVSETIAASDQAAKDYADEQIEAATTWGEF